MEPRYRICLADDHPIMRLALREVLDEADNLEIVAEANDGVELLAQAEEHLPDLIITDLSMPKLDGLGAIQRLRKSSSTAKILVFTMHTEPEYVSIVLEAGAQGYLPKGASHDDVLQAVRCVLAGEIYLPSWFPACVLQDAQGRSRTQ